MSFLKLKNASKFVEYRWKYKKKRKKEKKQSKKRENFRIQCKSKVWVLAELVRATMIKARLQVHLRRLQFVEQSQEQSRNKKQCL